MRSSGKLAALAFIAVVMSTGLLALMACSGGSPEPTTVPTSSAPPSTTPSDQGGYFGQRGGMIGTIARIDGNVLTLTTDNGDTTVSLTADTTIQRVVSGTLADLRVGQFLSVTGSADASSNVAASSVTMSTHSQTPRFSPPTGTGPSDGGRFSPPSGTPSFTRPTGIPANGAFGSDCCHRWQQSDLGQPAGTANDSHHQFEDGHRGNNRGQPVRPACGPVGDRGRAAERPGWH